MELKPPTPPGKETKQPKKKEKKTPKSHKHCATCNADVTELWQENKWKDLYYCNVHIEEVSSGSKQKDISVSKEGKGAKSETNEKISKEA